MDELQDSYALGLDLGTTFSCIGVYKNGGVEIIPNRNGERTTPSIVTILEGAKILKGEETLDYLVKDYDSSIYAIKRFIGRKFNDENVKNEIKKENFPFQIIGDKDGKFPLVFINKKDEKIKFTLEEISSFVIKKMVDSAEAYLNKKVNKLVITVPANFTDAQRNCTKQAANLAGIEVLRIINEPTAAALAYGFGQNKNEKGEKKDQNILVFDLGGGTFDVTILKINQSEEQNFDILSTKGDKFLGGEDFDNKLVDYVLDKFCEKMNESKEQIKQDKKAIKKLKISCENIKRVLSSNEETTLCLSNFYKGNGILEDITRKDFDEITQDLIKRLENPITDALIDAKLAKNEINEIILVGGSSRIPKVKKFLNEYFPKVHINDSINPDETVAFGATLMAAKILIKNDNTLSGFNLMDITPLSLGIEVQNDSTDPEIKKEGGEMSVIIKRASKIPFPNIRTYQTVEDNQTSCIITIYEGEKKYTKYNHILGKVELSGLPKKKKGEVKIDVKFFIDVNGILTVTATEKSTGKSITTSIKNDTVNLTNEDIKALREKNKKYYEKSNTIGNKDIDYSNLKETLKEFQEALNEADDEEDKYNILMNYNNTLEEFINLFNIDNFDNETMVEKYYIYVRDLFYSYIKVLKIKKFCIGEEQETIIKKIKQYIEIFTKKSLGYLNNLIEILFELVEDKDLKKIFFDILVYAMDQLNNRGKECLEAKKEFCKYNSLIYFEKSNMLFLKYINKASKLAASNRDLMKPCKEINKISLIYINEINSGAILLFEESLRSGKLIESKNTGFTASLRNLQLTGKQNSEKYQIILSHYEKMLSEFSSDKSIQKEQKKKEAICIANIIKISYKFLGNSQFKRYLKLGERCEFLASDKDSGIDTNEDWYKEFKNILKEINQTYFNINQNESDMKAKIRQKYKEKFDEIEIKFTKKKDEMDFINYILKIKPFKDYNEDKKNGNFEKKKKESLQNFIKYLQAKYHPDDYSYNENEESKLDFCLIEYIDSFLNRMFTDI